MEDQKNLLLAIVLTGVVLIGWQYLFAVPQMEKQKQLAQQQQTQTQSPTQQPAAGAQPGAPPQVAPGAAPQAPQAPGAPSAAPTAVARSRARGLAAHPHRHPAAERLARPDGRPHRRPGAGAVPRDRRSELAPDRAAGALRQPAAVLCRVRLDRRRRNHRQAAGAGHAVAAGGQRRACGRPSGDARLRQRRGPGVPPQHRRRRQVPLHRQGRRGQQRRGRGDALSLCAGLAPRHAGARLRGLARGPDRRHGRQLPAAGRLRHLHRVPGGELQDARGKEGAQLRRRQRLVRLRRQILGRDLAARDRCQAARQVLLRPDRAAANLPGRLSARSADGRAGRHRHGGRPAVRRRQGGRDRQCLRFRAASQPLRAADRLGAFLLHHPADVLGDRPHLPLRGQFRRRDPDHHGHHQGHLLPARQQVLRLDGQDEGGAAGDDRHPHPLRRRQGEAAAGHDGAVQARQDQSGRRLPADRHPDPGILLALQGAVRHHRDAARAVLRLDQGSVRPRSHQRVQSVRAHSLRSDAVADGRLVPASGRLAADHGRHHVPADEAQPAAAGPGPAGDLQLDAGHLHLHAGELLGRAGDLLGLEQFALGRPAERDHEQARRQDRAPRQHQGAVPAQAATAAALDSKKPPLDAKKPSRK